MKTFDILDEIRALEDLLYEVNEETGEVTDNSDLLKEEITKIQTNTKAKLNNIERLKREKQSQIQAIKDEVARLQKRSKTLGNEVQSLTNLEMYLTNSEKVDTGLFKFGTRKTKSLNIVNEEAIPNEWFNEEIIRSLNKRGLLKFAKENDVSGVEIVEKISLSVR